MVQVENICLWIALGWVSFALYSVQAVRYLLWRFGGIE